MSNFETKDQSKRNLVGDAKLKSRLSAYDEGYEDGKDLYVDTVERLNKELSELKEKLMSDAVDVELELINVKGLNYGLKQQVLELKEKAKAWDDLDLYFPFLYRAVLKLIAKRNVEPESIRGES